MAQPWSNKIIGYGEVATDDILAHPQNWRIHPAHQQAALKGVLDDVGIVQNILINKRTSEQWPAGDRYVQTLVDGHARVQLALRHGQQTLPVTYCDLTPAEETEILLTLDPLSALATADSEKLAELLAEIQSADAAVTAMLDGLAHENGLGIAATSQPSHEHIQNGSPDIAPVIRTLAERFLVPPFSVLDARQGYWQSRKRAWIALGIQSELGRGESPESAANPPRSDDGLIIDAYRKRGRGLLDISPPTPTPY